MEFNPRYVRWCLDGSLQEYMVQLDGPWIWLLLMFSLHYIALVLSGLLVVDHDHYALRPWYHRFVCMDKLCTWPIVFN